MRDSIEMYTTLFPIKFSQVGIFKNTKNYCNSYSYI